MLLLGITHDDDDIDKYIQLQILKFFEFSGETEEKDDKTKNCNEEEEEDPDYQSVGAAFFPRWNKR